MTIVLLDCVIWTVTRRERGVRSPKNIANVFYEWPLTAQCARSWGKDVRRTQRRIWHSVLEVMSISKCVHWLHVLLN